MDYKEKIYAVIGAAMEVHRVMKHGLAEPIYQEALEYEFRDRAIPYAREVQVPVIYKSHVLDKYYQMDFVCYDDIILELKAAYTLTSEHRFQLFNYLRLTRKPYGILINFGEQSLHVERYCFDPETNECRGISAK